MTQPRLYCLCAATIVDEGGVPARGALTCTKCGKNRCAKCAWVHLRACLPDLFMRLRTQLLNRRINEFFEPLDNGG
jgi:hypothetical protein